MTYSLMDSLMTTNALGSSIKPVVTHWSKSLNEFCEDSKKESITPQEWQIQIDLLYRKIDLKELLQFIHFENLKKNFDYPDLGVNTQTINFPKLEGLPQQTVL